MKKADNLVTISDIPGAPFLASLQRIPVSSNFIFAIDSSASKFLLGSICNLYFAVKSVPGASNPDDFSSLVFTIVRGPNPKLAPGSSGDAIMISLRIKSASPRLKVSPKEMLNLDARSRSIIALLGLINTSLRDRPLSS